MVRRSPRLSSRPPTGPSNQNSHQLHYVVSSRPTLNSYRPRQHSTSRSISPSTILDESGQSVPVTFENTEEVTVSRTTVGSSPREDMPRHLYGKSASRILYTAFGGVKFKCWTRLGKGLISHMQLPASPA